MNLMRAVVGFLTGLYSIIIRSRRITNVLKRIFSCVAAAENAAKCIDINDVLERLLCNFQKIYLFQVPIETQLVSFRTGVSFGLSDWMPCLEERRGNSAVGSRTVCILF